MLIFYDPDTLLHETVELLAAKVQPALESPARIKATVDAIQKSKHELKTISADDKDEQKVLDLAGLTHDPQYLEHYKNVHKEWVSAGIITESESVLPECFVYHTIAHIKPLLPKDIYARSGYYAFDLSSGVAADTWRSVIASANLAVQAVEYSVQHQNTTLALCRPPGHHCDGHKAGGYCYINNAALAVDAFRRHHHNKALQHPNGRCNNSHNISNGDGDSFPLVAILDLDFHHGNGTQEIFYDDPSVLYVSIHGADEFPYYTGHADETGTASSRTPSGQQTNLNLPLPTRSSFAPAYLAHLHTALAAISAFRPAFLVVSLGFDTFNLDPLGNFQIFTEDYETMARTVRAQIPQGIPAVIILEGGYVIEQLGPNLLSFVRGWEEAVS